MGAEPKYREKIWLLSLVGSILSLPVIVGYQIFDWLYTGQWHGIALANWITPSVLPLNDFWQWVAEPHSWLGLHRVVVFLIYDVPVWMWLAFSLYFISYRMEDKQSSNKT